MSGVVLLSCGTFAVAFGLSLGVAMRGRHLAVVGMAVLA
jgi:hypothetical protein